MCERRYLHRKHHIPLLKYDRYLYYYYCWRTQNKWVIICTTRPCLFSNNNNNNNNNKMTSPCLFNSVKGAFCFIIKVYPWSYRPRVTVTDAFFFFLFLLIVSIILKFIKKKKKSHKDSLKELILTKFLQKRKINKVLLLNSVTIRVG